MGFFNKFIGVMSSKKAIAPTPTDSTLSALIPTQDNNYNAFMYGHENAYTDLPNILGPLNTNVAYHDPYAVQSPFRVRREDEYIVGPGGKHFFDGANPDIERIPRSALQVQFDTKREIPIPPALVPDSGVEVPVRNYNYGWSQVGVQLEGMYQASVLTSPPQKLSRGINVLQQNIPNDAHRPSMRTRAPKQKRSV